MFRISLQNVFSLLIINFLLLLKLKLRVNSDKRNASCQKICESDLMLISKQKPKQILFKLLYVHTLLFSLNGVYVTIKKQLQESFGVPNC